jgi:hypothetical protein
LTCGSFFSALEDQGRITKELEEKRKQAEEAQLRLKEEREEAEKEHERMVERVRYEQEEKDKIVRQMFYFNYTQILIRKIRFSSAILLRFCDRFKSNNRTSITSFVRIGKEYPLICLIPEQ